MLDLDAAASSNNRAKQRELVAKLKDAVQAGKRAAETRVEVRQLIQERTKVVDREHKRIVAMQGMLTTDQTNAVFERILDELDAVVTDPEMRRELNVRLARIGGAVGEEVA